MGNLPSFSTSELACPNLENTGASALSPRSCRLTQALELSPKESSTTERTAADAPRAGRQVGEGSDSEISMNCRPVAVGPAIRSSVSSSHLSLNKPIRQHGASGLRIPRWIAVAQLPALTKENAPPRQSRVPSAIFAESLVVPPPDVRTEWRPRACRIRRVSKPGNPASTTTAGPLMSRDFLRDLCFPAWLFRFHTMHTTWLRPRRPPGG